MSTATGTRIARRAVLAAPLLALATGRAATQTPQRLAPGPTMSAAAFLDTIGVGSHWEYKDTVYGSHAEQLVRLLGGSGIRHVRGYERSLSEQLAEMGIRTTLVAGPEVGTPEQIADMVDSANRDRAVIDAVEGPNEADLFWPEKGYRYRSQGFPQGVLAYQRELYRAIKDRPRIARVLVIGPSLGRAYDPGGGQPNPFSEGSLTDAVDLGNFHPYPFGGNSFSPRFAYGTIERYYWNGNFPSVNLDEFPYNPLVYSPPFRPKPMAATETGYFTGREGIPEAVHARYIPRLFAEYARLSVRRTYVYELADEDVPANAGTMQAHFGLLRADASPKPAFTALRSLLRLIGREAVSDVQVVRPDLRIEPRMPPGYDRTGFVHSLVLQTTPSRYLLLLWHEVANADTSSTPPREISVPDGSVTLVLPEDMRATALHAYGPEWELQSQPLRARAGRTEVPLRDSIVVLALERQGAARVPAAPRR